MSAGLIIFLFTLIYALLCLVLRHQRMASALAAAIGAGSIAAFVLLVPFDEAFLFGEISIKFASEWIILGRMFSLSENVRPLIGFLYLAGAFLLPAAWIVNANRFFPSVALLILAIVAASLMVDPFVFAAVFIELAAMGAVFVLVTQQHPRSTGATRMLILYTFAMISILFVGSLLEVAGITSATPVLALRVTFILGFGFAILMTVPPFHLWLPKSAEESDPYILVFILVILQSAGFFFLLRFLDSYVWLREQTLIYDGIRIAGIVTTILAVLLSASQRDVKKLMAYALLVDLGVILIAIGSGTEDAFRLALSLSAVRVIALGVLALGLSYLCNSDRLASQMRGVGYKMPFAAAAFLVGLLSVAGTPLTAGFPGRWSLLTEVLQADRLAAGTVLFSMVGLGVLVIRWAAILFGRGDGDEIIAVSKEPRIFLLGGILILLLLGLFPQLVFPWVEDVASGLANLFL
ncbi:MAG: proton-conducting transporter membrane subunit [Chloroflexota bacterium]|nr:proton-conducting transporter membrane subunit [Chloroflexota bacterium]